MKLNKKNLIAAVLLMAITSTSSIYAADNPINRGFYIGGQIGVADYDLIGNNNSWSDTYSITHDPRVSGRLSLGYKFNKFISEELGADIYHTATREMDLGKAQIWPMPGQIYTSTFSQFYALDLMTKVSMPITKGFSFFIKGGPALVHVHYSAPQSTLPPASSVWQWSWKSGSQVFITGRTAAGFSLNVSKKSAVTLSVSHVFGIGNTYDDRNYLPDVDTASIGYVYQF